LLGTGASFLDHASGQTKAYSLQTLEGILEIHEISSGCVRNDRHRTDDRKPEGLSHSSSAPLIKDQH
jgi:hypothetical protein